VRPRRAATLRRRQPAARQGRVAGRRRATLRGLLAGPSRGRCTAPTAGA